MPRIEYTEAEQEVWRTVCRELPPKHESYACKAFRERSRRSTCRATGSRSSTRSQRPRPLTGFEYVPAAGIVPLDEFYGSLADRRFHSTQYVRHHDAPLYTPEPDLIHEVIGHGHLLADPQFAEVNRLAGEAARRDGDPRGPADGRRRLLVHDRVRRRPRRRGAARLRRRHPLLLRRDRGVPRDGDPPARLRAMATIDTTSPSTSRSCSARSRSNTWSTRSGRSSRSATTTPRRGSSHSEHARATQA